MKTAPHPGPKLNVKWWLNMLNTLPNNKDNILLKDGIKYGVSLGITHQNNFSQKPSNVINSVEELEQLLLTLIRDLKQHNIHPVSYTPYYINSVFMRKEPTKYRLITNASYKAPYKVSINESIQEEYKPVYLYNLKRLCLWLYNHGAKTGLYVSTMDLHDYFHQFMIRAEDVPYTGYQIFGKTLTALYAPFGISSVPRIGCTHSEITTVAFHRQVGLVDQDTYKYYVDDSTLINPDPWQLHLNGLKALKIMKQAGLQESVNKRVWCQNVVKIYGWIFDLQYNNLKIYYPYKKRQKLKHLLDVVINNKYVELRVLFKLSGTIMHYSQVNIILKVMCLKLVGIIYGYIDQHSNIRKQLRKIVLIPKWLQNHLKI